MVEKAGTQERATIVFAFERSLDPKLATPSARIAWDMVGAAMQMRFLELFREEMSATYGVGVRTGWDQRWTQAELKLSFQCAPKRATELRKAALKEITRLTTEGIGADHLAKAKQAAVRKDEISLTKNTYWIDTLAYLSFNDLALREILDQKDLIASIATEHLKSAQALFVAVDKPAIAVLLPKK